MSVHPSDPSRPLLVWLVVLLLGGVTATLSASTAGSDRYLIDSWQSDDGLPQGSVIALARTRDGYLWVGTFGGLARFDGVRFQVFYKANTPELPGDAITKLYEAHDGALLVCTALGGVAALRAGRFERLLDEQKEGDDVVAAITARAGGTILSSLSGLLWRYADGKITALCQSRESGPLLQGPIHPGVLCEDKQGTLWTLGAANRLLRFTSGTWEVARQQNALSGASGQALARDIAGLLWLGTAEGLAVLDQGGWQQVTLPELPELLNVDDAFPSRDGGTWFANSTPSRREFWKIKDGHRVLSAQNVADTDARLYPLGEDASNGLCLGSMANGFYRISTNGTVMHLDRQSGLPGNSVRSYLLDREGNEWLGLDDGGLVKLRLRTVGAFDNESSAAVAIRSVCEDHRGVIWAGTSSEGLLRGEGARLTPFGASANPGLLSVWSVLEDRSHNLWLGTFGDGLFRREGTNFVPAFDPTLVRNRVRAIYEDSRGRLWLGCRAGLAYFELGKLTLLPGPKGAVECEVQCILEDGQKRLWAGTRGEGLLCFNDNKLTQYRTADGLANDNVLSIYLDAEQALWIGTAGGGLSLMRDGRFVNFTSREGLPDDIICHIAEDGRGHFWFSSSQGVFSVARSEFEAVADRNANAVKSTLYDRAGGMPTRECSGGTQPSGWTTLDGRLLIPTIKGVAVVQPEAVRVNRLPPPVLIEEVQVDGAQVKPGASDSKQARRPRLLSAADASLALSVPPGQQHLRIRYTALSLTAPEKVRFKVRLEPLDKDWIDVGARRDVDYSFLRPGQYQFRVIACNNDGIWNEEGAGLAVTWPPHFWQAGWFTVLWIISLTGGVAGLVGYAVRRRQRLRLEKMEQARTLENERARIARDLHDDLGSSLTEIGLLGALAVRESTPPAEAKAQLIRIMDRSQELAQTLDETVWAVNPKNDWLARLATYLCHFAKEFLEPTEIRCRLDVPPDLPEAPLTAEVRHNIFLVVKEALNNAVRHSGATEVTLRMAVVDGRFVLEVVDNGHGFCIESRRETGNGLRNMARRMEQVAGGFEVQSGPAAGTTLRLRLPLSGGGSKAGPARQAQPAQTERAGQAARGHRRTASRWRSDDQRDRPQGHRFVPANRAATASRGHAYRPRGGDPPAPGQRLRHQGNRRQTPGQL